MSNETRNVLMVAFNFPPSVTAGVHRTIRFTRYLPEHNWQTAILTSTPRPGSQTDPRLATLVPDDVEVTQVALKRPEDAIKERLSFFNSAQRNQEVGVQPLESNRTESKTSPTAPSPPPIDSILRRARKQVVELLFALPDDKVGWKNDAVSRGLEIVQQQNSSVVYATAPPFSSLLVGREIARKANLPLVLDFRDPWTRVPWGPRNKSWMANRWVARLEHACVREASAVVLNTPELEDDFVQHYPNMPREKFVSITNGIDPEVHANVDAYMRQEQLPTRTGRPLRLLHPGSLYRNRDPRPIVDAIADLKQQGTSVILEQVGYCDPNFDLMNYAADRGVADQIEMKPAIPHDQMLRRMAKVDGFVLLQPGTALQIPGKLFEMILFRKPILAICIPGAVSNVIERFKIGTIAEAGNVESISAAIARLESTDPSFSDFDEAITKFDGRQLTQQMASVFDSVAGRNNGRPR